MGRPMFDRPVRVFAGLGIPLEIDSAFQAYTFLAELPGQAASPDYLDARNACLAAASGTADLQTARRAFRSYADRRGILAPEAEALGVTAKAVQVARPAA